MNNNGWITDRLPTRHDVDFTSMVWIWDENLNRHALNDYERVILGTPWQPVVEPTPYVKPRWKPKKDERYWYVDSSQIHFTSWDGFAVDERRYSIGNCFQTKEEAREVFEKFAQLLKEHWDGK